MDLSERAGSRDALITRAQPFDGAELRESGAGLLTFTGYASVFNRSYQVFDAFGPFEETIKPGAFRDSLASGADVPFKINHDGMTLARTKSGTMKLAEDAHGLHVEAQLDPRNSEVQNLRSAMERGDIDEMSFAFRATDDTWSEDWTQRAIRGADIHKGDVSAVNYGASPHTAGAKLRTADMVRALRSIQPAELDDDTREALLHVLQLVAAADGAVDVAQPKLAAILGVPNPDIDAASADQIAEKKSLTSLYALRARLLSL